MKFNHRELGIAVCIIGLFMGGLGYQEGYSQGVSEPYLVDSSDWCQERNFSGGYYSGFASSPEVFVSPETSIKCYTKEDGNFTEDKWYALNERHEVVKEYPRNST